MNSMVPLALYGWIPLVIGLFMLLPPRRAVITAFLIAWLFLPMAGYKFAGMPEYTKMTATVFGILLGAALFDFERLLTFRFRWIDLPMALYVLSPLFSSLSNGLGLYDGMSEVLDALVDWGLPYYIGRVYFTNLEEVKELTIGLIIGGVIYLPLCWFEMRMSPQLHRMIYGYHPHSFSQQLRFGGYRPMVFMQHGLMVGMWMAMTALAATWLWKSKAWRQTMGIPAWLLVGLMLITAVFTRSSFAIMLLLFGLIALVSVTTLRTRWVIIALMLIPPTFVVLRTSQIVDGYVMVEWAEQWFGEQRAKSIETRVENDNALSAKAMERPIFGWGGWGRNRILNEEGESQSVTDSLWVIVLGVQGVVGLSALLAALLLPMALVIRDYRTDLWIHPRVAPVVVLALILVLYMIDHLLNAMLNPLFAVAAGAVGSAHVWAEAQKRLAAQTQRVVARPRPPVFAAHPA